MASKLIVGLGNPGEDRLNNRHNIGFRCADYAASRLGIKFTVDKKKSVYGKKVVNGDDLIVLKPQTYINLSGEAVLYIASFLKVKAKNILVIYDDINIKIGDVEAQRDFEHIEHNAIIHLRRALRESRFLRIGVGINNQKQHKYSEEEFYLSDFTEKDEEILDDEDVFERTYRLALKKLKVNPEN